MSDLHKRTSDSRKCYQPRINRVKDEKGDLIRDSHSILDTWRNHFSQLLNIHGVNDVRQTEIHTAEPLVPESSAFDFGMAFEKLKVTNHLVLIKSEQNRLKQEVKHFALRSINLFIIFGIRNNYLRKGRSGSLYLCIGRVIIEIVVIIKAYHFYQLHTQFYPPSCCHG
jgi:hypothetical protein